MVWFGVSKLFVRGPHKLIQKMWSAGRLTQCDCFGMCYIVPNQQIFRNYIFSSLRKRLRDRMKWLREP